MAVHEEDIVKLSKRIHDVMEAYTRWVAPQNQQQMDMVDNTILSSLGAVLANFIAINVDDPLRNFESLVIKMREGIEKISKTDGPSEKLQELKERALRNGGVLELDKWRNNDS